MRGALWDTFLRGQRRVEDPNELKGFISHYAKFTFPFVFKGEAQKKYDAADFREGKTSLFIEDQAETWWKVCTSYEADQLHFPQAGHKDNFPSWSGGLAQAPGGDPGEAPASLCLQEIAGTPGPQQGRTYESFAYRKHRKNNCAGQCRCWVSAHQPWAQRCTVIRLGRDDPRSGSLSPTASPQTTGNTWRHPETDPESEKSTRETGRGLEGRQAGQGSREPEWCENWMKNSRRSCWRTDRCGPRAVVHRERARFYLPPLTSVSCSGLWCCVVVKLYFIKLFWETKIWRVDGFVGERLGFMWQERRSCLCTPFSLPWFLFTVIVNSTEVTQPEESFSVFSHNSFL